MSILVAPDSFKGSLTSRQAAAAIAAGIRSVMPDVNIICMPLADGGEGTLHVLQNVYGGDMHHEILYFDHEACRCALIESARFIGLTLTSMQNNVFDRGSTALGHALFSALDTGVDDIRIALGGSATVDGGLGLLMALGCRVMDGYGATVSADLNGLMRARRIDIGGLDQRLKDVRLTLLSDVQNPLCGDDGAVYVYGLQKGIESHRLSDVESAMQHWGDLCGQSFDLSVQQLPGSGAAGGIGFALQLLGRVADVALVSGAELVMQASGFDQALHSVDWVVTGEGRSDAQTLQSKLPYKVAQAARRDDVSVALISGEVSDRQLLETFFDHAVSAKPEGVPIIEAMQQAEYYLTQAAAGWARYISGE